MSKENLDKEIKLDTSFDLLKTDGFDLSSVGIIKKNEETTDDESDKKEEKEEKEEKQENVEEKKEETNLKDIYLEQLYTFGDIDRDPRYRILSVSYLALCPFSAISNVGYQSCSIRNIKRRLFARETG